jgi:endoglycosylceramidase
MLQYAFGNCRPFASYEIPVDETTGLPIPEECNKRNFLQLYTTPEVASAFEHFWQNTNGLQDKFMDFWKVVATKFANNSNVLGYDIFNEPFTANTYKDSSLFYDQNKFDRTVLHQFYMRAHEVIRTVDPDHFIFFEPA